MPFDWGSDINQATEDALTRLAQYNSGIFNAGTNPYGMAGGGHISNFPLATGDTAQAAVGFALFADVMAAYANTSSSSATSAAAAASNLSATSTSSVTLSTGAKSFVTQAGKTFPVGSILLVSSNANPTTHWMAVQVTSYSLTALAGTALVFSGSGSRTDWTIRLTGYPGRAAGASYIWSTLTGGGDPTSGKVMVNAAPASATVLYLSKTDADGNALGPLIATWDDSLSTPRGRLTIVSITQPQNFLVLDIQTTLTDFGTYDTLAVTVAASGGALVDGMQVAIGFSATGSPGSTGPTGPSYAATSTTSLAIGTGSKVFTTQAGLAYTIGTRARAADVANPTVNWMEGVVTAYSSTLLTILVDLTSGSGTLANWNISVAGERGAIGTTGAGGDDAGFEFQFNSAVAGDPTSGHFLFNNATFASATQWAISETDGNGLNVASLLAALDDGLGTNKILVFIIKQGGAAYFSFYVTSTFTDQGAYDTCSITPIATAGSIVNNDTFHVVTIPMTKGDTGTTGAAGPTTAPVWNFDAGTTAVDPGTNEFALNSATIASVNTIYINETGPGASNLSAFIDQWDTTPNSTLFITQTNDATKYAIFTITSVVDSGVYDTITVVYVAGPGGFTVAQACAFAFARAGAAGAGSGTVTGPGSSTTNALALWASGAGTSIKDSLVEQVTSGLSPFTTDTVALGTTTKMWSDLFLATGAVVNWNNGNTVLTHSSAVLTLGTGDLRVTTAGTNSTSVVTVGGSQTLTGKTLTSPVINTPTGITKTDVGLANVDNTSDANKPVSTAEAAINAIKKFVSVRAATTANVVSIANDLNNADVIDGVTLATGDLVLLKNQSSPAENGIYVVGVSPARHSEYDTYNEHPGTNVTVQEGTTNADTLWMCTSNNGGTINSSSIVFAQLDVTAYTAAATLTLSSHQFALNLSNANTWAASQTFINSSGIKILDTDASHTLGIIVGSDLTANRTLTWTFGDTDRTVQLGGNIITAAAFTISGASALTLTVVGTTNVTLPTTGTLATTDASSLNNGTLPDARLSSAATAYGRQKIPIPADAWWAATTNGPGTSQIVGTNLERRSVDFDTTTQETMYTNVPMPAQWNEGTFTFEVEWEHPATTVNFGVAFDLAAVAIGDNESGDPALGTAIVVTDTGGTTNNHYKTAESAAVTAAGTISAGDILALRFRRVPANASDTLAVDARVKSVNLYITTDAGHD